MALHTRGGAKYLLITKERIVLASATPPIPSMRPILLGAETYYFKFHLGHMPVAPTARHAYAR